MTATRLESLRRESRVSFPTLQGPDVFTWEQALPKLQAMLQAQKLETTVALLTNPVVLEPSPDGDGFVGAPVVAPKTLTKKQLESILLLSPGYIQTEVGELVKPVVRDGKSFSVVVTLEHTAPMYDEGSRPRGHGTIWEVFGIEKNGTVHGMGTQY